MLRQKQLLKHNPDEGIYGDCHRTALACLLDIPVEQAPHFIGENEARRKRGETDDMLAWLPHQAAWLAELGYATVDISFHGDEGVEPIFRYMQARNPNIYYLLGGTSPRGTHHTVICCGGGFEWDPHPDGGFLTGPFDNGFYEITFLVPVSMVSKP